MPDSFSLKWNDFQTSVSNSLGIFRKEEDFFDVIFFLVSQGTETIWMSNQYCLINMILESVFDKDRESKHVTRNKNVQIKASSKKKSLK